MKAALLSLTLAATTSTSMPSRAEPPLLTPPPPPSDQPLPDLQQRGRSCGALQQALNRLIAPVAWAGSVSVVNSNGALRGDGNGEMASSPAPNHKHTRTAIAPDH